MGDFDRNAGRRSSGRGRSDRSSGGFGGGRGRGSFGGGRDRGGFGGRDRDRGGDRGGFDSRDRGRRTERHEMHSAVCDKCGKDCEVPFRPTQGKPIYCDDCFKSNSREAGSRSEMGKPINNEIHDQINKKLDKILMLLEGKKDHVEQKEEPQKAKKSKSETKPEVKTEAPVLEYADDIEEKKPKKKKAKKKK